MTFGGNGSANWGDLGQIDFGKAGAIADFAEVGRIVSVSASDILQAQLNSLYLEILGTQWMGGQSRENKARARRLLSPLKWSANHALPAACRRFAQLPERYKHIYEEQLAAVRSPNRRRGIDPGA